MLTFFANRLKIQSLHNSCNPIYILSRIVGLFPYSLVEVDDNPDKKSHEKFKKSFHFSFPLSLITILWAISYLVAHILANQSVLAIPTSRNYPIISVVGEYRNPQQEVLVT